jgi:hypothetical protein
MKQQHIILIYIAWVLKDEATTYYIVKPILCDLLGTDEAAAYYIIDII